MEGFRIIRIKIEIEKISVVRVEADDVQDFIVFVAGLMSESGGDVI